MPSVRHVLLVTLVLVLSGAAQAAETAQYVVLRDGEPVGNSLQRFERHGDRLEVTTDVSVRVAVGFLTVYQYRHFGREVWHGDRLVALDTETDDNGHQMSVSGRQTAQGFKVESGEGVAIVPPDIRPTSYWREDAMAQGRLLDTETGRVVGVTAAKLDGSGSGQGSQLERYRLSGDLKTPLELTYAEGRLLQARLRKRGSEIEFRATALPDRQIAAAGARRD